jgi:hypothetical protein
MQLSGRLSGGQVAIAIHSWVSDPQRLVRGREGARKRVRDDFNLPSVAARLWDEYTTLLRGKAA